MQRPLRARARAGEAVESAASGPLRDRLGETLARLDEAVASVWAVARQGQAASEARTALDPAGLRRRLDRALADDTGASLDAGADRRDPLDPSDATAAGALDATAATVAALQAQLAGVERLDEVVARARNRLEVLDAGMEETTARLIELGVRGEARCSGAARSRAGDPRRGSGGPAPGAGRDLAGRGAASVSEPPRSPRDPRYRPPVPVVRRVVPKPAPGTARPSRPLPAPASPAPARTVPAHPAPERPAPARPVAADASGGEARQRRGGLLRSSALVAGGTLASRVSGLLRVGALAYALGSSGLTDLYNLANTTPNLIYELVLGGVLSATLVPVFIDRFDADDDDAVSAVVTVATIGLVALTAMAVLVAPLLLRAYLVLRDDDVSDLVATGVPLMRWFLPQIVFYGFTTLGTALLNARNRFSLPAYVPVLNNLVVSAALIAVPTVAGRDLTARGVADEPATLALLGLGTTAGVAVMSLALWPGLRRAGIRLRWRPDWHHPVVRQVARLSGWTIGYVVANQVALIAVQALAVSQTSTLSQYNFAFIFFQLPHGLISVSLMTTFLPELARAATRGRWRAFRARAGQGIRAISFLVIPAAVGFMVLAEPLVDLLRRGEFSAGDADGVARALVAFAPGIVGFSLYLFAIRCFYALKDTRTPFWLNLFENAVNVVAAALAWSLVGHSATTLAAGFSVAYVSAALVALAVLRRRVGGLEGTMTGRALILMALAAAAMASAVRPLDGLPLPLGIGVGAVVYFAVLGGLALVGARLTRSGGPGLRRQVP